MEKERERYQERPGLNMKEEELVAKVRREEKETGKRSLSLIVVGKSDLFSSVSFCFCVAFRPRWLTSRLGHVDAGKSTLMGRLLYDLGELSEKERTANERGSKKIGKGSFAFAWGLDALGDERDR